MKKTLLFKWTVSRGRDTYGYNICSLWVDGSKLTSCNGGGYDMKGTSLGLYIACAFAEKLNTLKEEFYGLTYHNPNYKCSEEVVEKEKAGESFGLERYQDFYKQSSKLPTERHTIPQIDGACGFSSVEDIMKAIGLRLKYVHGSTNESIYLLTNGE
tara:strand:- start:36 stop:503 length:468 start_codon:yes stop_codon:yes gene_type:complete